MQPFYKLFFIGFGFQLFVDTLIEKFEISLIGCLSGLILAKMFLFLNRAQYLILFRWKYLTAIA